MVIEELLFDGCGLEEACNYDSDDCGCDHDDEEDDYEDEDEYDDEDDYEDDGDDDDE